MRRPHRCLLPAPGGREPPGRCLAATRRRFATCTRVPSADALLRSVASLSPGRTYASISACTGGEPPMSTHTSPHEKKLRDRLAVATTWEEFGKALQEFRMAVRPSLSQRVMERNPDFPSRSAISARETGRQAFSEEGLRAYLHELHATADLIDYCITQHRRIAQLPQATHERPAAQTAPDSTSTSGLRTESQESDPASNDKGTAPTPRTIIAKLAAQVLAPQEIPTPEVEAARLLQRVDSYVRTGEIQHAADTAVEAANMCDSIYSPDHPITLYARTVELRWASELFTRSHKEYQPLPPVVPPALPAVLQKQRWMSHKKQEQLRRAQERLDIEREQLRREQEQARMEQEQVRANQEKNAEKLRERWEALISGYQRVYGADHRETLHTRRHYAHHLRQKLGNHTLFRNFLVELIADAEVALGPQDDFPLQMRYMLTWTDNKKGGWEKLLEQQFKRELDWNHPMSRLVESYCHDYPYRRDRVDFLDYDQMK
jgi:hypothetical protein